MVKTIGEEMMEEAQVEQCQKVLLRQGKKLFGDVTPDTEAAIQSIQDLARLNRMVDSIIDVDTWTELLQTA